MNRHSEMIQDETFFPCEMFIFTEAPIQQKATGVVLGSRCDEECGNIKNQCTRVLDANKLPAANAQAMKIFICVLFPNFDFSPAHGSVQGSNEKLNPSQALDEEHFRV